MLLSLEASLKAEAWPQASTFRMPTPNGPNTHTDCARQGTGEPRAQQKSSHLPALGMRQEKLHSFAQHSNVFH